MKKSKSGGENTVLSAVRAVVIGAVCGAVLCALLLCLCAFAFVSSRLFPQGVIFPLTLIISALGSLLSGIVTAKLQRKRGLLFGALAGLLLFLLFLLAGLLSFQEVLGAAAGTRVLVMVLCGAIGGLLVVNRKTKVK